MIGARIKWGMHSPLNPTDSSVRVLQITADQTESLVEGVGRQYYQVTYIHTYIHISPPMSKQGISEAEFKEFEPRLEFETWLVPLKIVFSVSRFEPALNWNRILAAQRCGLNSFNSAYMVGNILKNALCTGYKCTQLE